MGSPYDFQGDWSRMAQVIVHQSLKTKPGERVLLQVDSSFFPELTEQIRIEIVKAGAVEVATILMNSPALQNARTLLRRREDAEAKEMEDNAASELFELADIYIWLPNFWPQNVGQTEKILKTWGGRAVHFHWVPGWVWYSSDASWFRKLSEMYEQALYVDYGALADHIDRVVGALQDSTIELTNPAGTDLRFELRQAHFHRGNGNASKEFIESYAAPGSARDREVELPAGGVRTVDISKPVGRLVVPQEFFPGNLGGRFVGNLTFEFDGDRVTRLESQYHNDFVQAMWGLYTGDNDRIGEFIVGVNPALKQLPGSEMGKVMSYFGFGAGIVRFSIGSNVESGGSNETDFRHNWLFLLDATLKANGKTIIENGNLLLP